MIERVHPGNGNVHSLFKGNCNNRLSYSAPLGGLNSKL